MKNLFILIATVLLSTVCSFAQGLKLDIQPYIVKTVVETSDTSFVIKTDTCTQIGLTVTTGEDSANAGYVLYRPDGSVYEAGNKNVSFQAAMIVLNRPVSIPNINAVLRFWHIEAIKVSVPGEG